MWGKWEDGVVKNRTNPRVSQGQGSSGNYFAIARADDKGVMALRMSTVVPML
eukprot:evm.model.NODE_39321_length_22458_cov_23.188396.4